MLAKDRMRFFSHDVDMRNDLKIRGLRREFGNEGYAVWCYLLEVLTDTEYLCIDIDNMAGLLSADFDIDRERLMGIVGYCLQVGLFVKDGSMLYSKRHRERIMGVLDKAQEKSERGRRAVMARWGKNPANNTDEADGGTDVLPTNTNERREEKTGEEKTRKEKTRKDQKREYPCAEIVKVWNEVCVSLPKVLRLSDARRDKVTARLREWGGDNPEEMIAKAREFFNRIEASDFLTGRSGKWKASFDWLFDSRNNWIKVAEGNYDNKRGGGSRLSGSIRLGIGERIDENGYRTYGSGRVIIPQDAPPRPSERHSWNASNNQWILQ